ncbi:MAG: hypothetical protein QOD06_2733 [Candidatus Binatota bacterium]|nr:hypothetical protein [Candidatus Binatota bacterium]
MVVFSLAQTPEGGDEDLASGGLTFGAGFVLEAIGAGEGLGRRARRGSRCRDPNAMPPSRTSFAASSATCSLASIPER